MHDQFYVGMKIKDVIDQLKPKIVLEIGFGAGTNMMVLLTYTKKPGNDYKIISLSDDPGLPKITIPNDFVSKFLYVGGVSYGLLPKWKELKLPEQFDKPIDLCIIDSDHNYFTLKKELDGVYPLMSEKCAIAFHDTASKPCEHHLYYSNALDKNSNSMVQNTGYKDGTPYPYQEVMATLDVPMMRAIEEFLADHPDFKMLKHIDDCCGCTLIGRDFEYDYN